MIPEEGIRRGVVPRVTGVSPIVVASPRSRPVFDTGGSLSKVSHGQVGAPVGSVRPCRRRTVKTDLDPLRLPPVDPVLASRMVTLPRHDDVR